MKFSVITRVRRERSLEHDEKVTVVVVADARDARNLLSVVEEEVWEGDEGVGIPRGATVTIRRDT